MGNLVSRRRFLRLGASGAVVAVVAGIGAYLAIQGPLMPSVPSAQTPSPSPSIDKAKEEGMVTVYHPLWPSVMEVIRKGFESKYPGIKVEAVRGFGPLVERALAETRSGKHTLDVSLTSFAFALPLLMENIVAQYVSTEDAAYPAELRDPNGRWVLNHTGAIVISYHKDLTSDKVPQNYQEFTNPKFKGRTAIRNANIVPYIYLTLEKKVIGGDKYESWLKGLKNNDARIIPAADAQALVMIVGKEVDAAFGTYLSTVLDHIDKGAPIGYLKTKGTVLGDPLGAFINKHAPHPNAARLLRDYFLSEESVRKVAEMGVYIPMKPGIPSTIQGIEPKDVINPPPMTIEILDETKKKWNEIMGA